jgi:hypothetical protein
VLLVEGLEFVGFGGNGGFEGLLADATVGSRGLGFGVSVLFLCKVGEGCVIKSIRDVNNGLVRTPGGTLNGGDGRVGANAVG